MKIIADLHTHTIASTHAYSTILENCTYAAQAGLLAIAMTDHAPSTPDSPHIWHFENLHCLPREIAGVKVLKGAEVNILDADGNIDIAGALLSKLEWVVASFHQPAFAPATEEIHTAAYLKAAENPHIDVIGHPVMAQYPFDHARCLAKFKECGKLVEINESALFNKAGARENTVALVRACKQLEVPITVNTDCHFCNMIGKVPESTKLLEELGFPERLVVNADWKRFASFLTAKRPRISL
ncbi:MAG: phosphatase [Oscillospiraceae bacterium]